MLTRRQARWAEKLLEFNFKIIYRDDKSNQKADSLTRQTGSISMDLQNERLLQQKQIIFSSEKFLIQLMDDNNELIHNYIRRYIAENKNVLLVKQALEQN